VKKLLVSICLAASLLLGCGADRTFNGKYCATYGLFNKDEMKCPGVQYRVIPGNVIWGIVLAETIAAPIYFFGFSMYEPVGLK
jgi:hypothetical protein